MILSEKIAFPYENPQNTSRIKSIEKKWVAPLILPKIPQNGNLFEVKYKNHKVYLNNFSSKDHNFFYASLLGVLRAAEIAKHILNLENIISKQMILSFVNIEFYLKIFQDPDFEKSSLYEEFLIALQEMEYNANEQDNFPGQGFLITMLAIYLENHVKIKTILLS